jgi:Zn-dependent protease
MLQFSDTEKKDLLKAWVAISLAVSILETKKLSAIFGLGGKGSVALLIQAFVIYGFTIGVAFLAHEVLGHKLVAQRRYNLLAEFWADEMFLMLAIVTSFFGFVFAAPGAVVVSGVTRIETYGKIAAAGPAVNIILAFFFILLLKLLPNAGIISDVLGLSYRYNSWFALYNLIPISVLDGAKVFSWSRTVWGVLFTISLFLYFGLF